MDSWYLHVFATRVFYWALLDDETNAERHNGKSREKSKASLKCLRSYYLLPSPLIYIYVIIRV